MRCLALGLLCLVSACQCRPTVGGNTDGGGGGRAGGGGGGSSATGGQSGSGANNGQGGFAGTFDAGDGTTVVVVGGPNGWVLDGGPNGEGSGVSVLPEPDGGITLNQRSAELYFMWIANNNVGTVSKYDTRTGREVARYWSTIPKDCANSAGPPCTNGNTLTNLTARSYNPSRTAIDINGDVWVANRAVAAQGSVTKIANNEADCIDRNGNGRIDTSRDVNGDGRISTNAADGEMVDPTNRADPLQYDECVLFSTPVGSPAPANGVAGRALAISTSLESTSGDVWVGIHHESRMYKLSSLNGQPQPVAGAGSPPYVAMGFGPYGALVDRAQRLWVVAPVISRLAQIDTRTGMLVNDNIVAPAALGCSAYGLALDRKNRIWVASWGPNSNVCRYDPSTNQWDSFSIANVRANNKAFPWGRGITVSAAQPGYPDGIVYQSGWLSDGQPGSGLNENRSALIRLDATDGGVIPYGANAYIEMTDANTAGAIGVALDGDGQPWVNNASGNVTKVDNATGAITRTQQQAAGLYTYSDFTGYALRTFTAPLGTYRRVFEAPCAMPEWLRLTFDAFTPANTSVQAYVRVADTLAGLSTAPRFGPITTSPADLRALSLPKQKYLRAEFELRSVDGIAQPVLRSFNVQWACIVEVQ
jgi:hypothetical protein